MIVVDTFAVMAMIQSEAEESRLRGALARAGRSLPSAATLLEVQLVLANKRSAVMWSDIEALLAQYEIDARPFDFRQLDAAREAAVRFGKGRHPAGLNFGDCFAYALAKTEGLPLLCTGDDFAKTDIELA